jgi:hypothetical protein
VGADKADLAVYPIGMSVRRCFPIHSLDALRFADATAPDRIVWVPRQRIGPVAVGCQGKASRMLRFAHLTDRMDAWPVVEGSWSLVLSMEEIQVSSQSDQAAIRAGVIGSVLTAAGVLLSGPISLLIVSLVKAQPPWVDAATFVDHYHRIQSLPFYFGFVLIAGSITIVASIYQLSGQRTSHLIGLIMTSIAGGMIFFNYMTQTTYVPALVADYAPTADPIIAAIAMANPTAIAWAIEMWGYAFLGLGTWLVAGFFVDRGVERAAKILFVVNGIISVIGALWTALDLGWVLSNAGLVAFALWNVLYLVLAILVLLVLKKRGEGQAR